MNQSNNLSIYIGNTIKCNRQKNELTQNELAEKVGTKQPSIARLESGQVLPSLGFLKKVTDSLGMEIGIKLS